MVTLVISCNINCYLFLFHGFNLGFKICSRNVVLNVYSDCVHYAIDAPGIYFEGLRGIASRSDRLEHSPGQNLFTGTLVVTSSKFAWARIW